MLSRDWSQRKNTYDFVVVGSGYGGAITAARIAAANLNPKPSVCILERGCEWEPGKFPDTPERIAEEIRSDLNPLGLHEFLTYRDISLWKANGLGGTSLVNANVAIIPDPEVFDLTGWPKSLNHASLMPYYLKARATLDAGPHPRALELPKVLALKRRADEAGLDTIGLNIAVNFKPDGPNQHGVFQKKCIDCGDCVTGCNVTAKNTLYMNYLPMAASAGAEIYTQAKVEWIEKLDGGGWRIHGRRYKSKRRTEKFTVDAANVIFGAGSINTTEILLRSEFHGLRVSPRLGTRFSGNGDFFAFAYNSDHRTQVLGFGNHPQHPRAASPPGPTIVGAIRYNGGLPVEKRITIEDLSFPKGFVEGAARVFMLQPGVDTDTGDEVQERARVLQDADLFSDIRAGGALDHTMMYLVMGIDDARGTIVFERPFFERDGRVRVEWDDAGRQVVFKRITEELRRHARALGATFVENPTFRFLDLRHLVTAHPIGGCPIGEDYIQGAVDEFGRVFSGDGSVHEGLFVADGALLPSALGVNPFLTISALAERIAERKIQQMQGQAYPQPKVSVGFSAIDPLNVIGSSESELERLFSRAESLEIGGIVNSGAREIDPAKRIIRNDEYWKGFFPRGHVLNAMSSAIFTGFKKRFFKSGRRFEGITSDTDGRINARNSLEELNLTERKGNLEPGRYILLRYLDPPWQGYYDVFKLINDNLLIGRVYLGEFPNGLRLFTFPMTRVYGFDQMTVEDHRRLYERSTVPAKEELDGVWRMDAVSNANHASGVAYLKFDLKPDGRLESRYQLMGLIEGLVMPSFAANHFQLNDFTAFRDEIRKLDKDVFIGKYVTDLPAALSPGLAATSLGILHVEGEDRKRLGFYYILTRTEEKGFPTNTLLSPLLDVHLPAGLGMIFDEEMTGWYFPGQFTSAPGRAGDREIAGRIPASGKPAGAVECRFDLRMTINDVNEFIEGYAHEARASGIISFGEFEGAGPVTFTVDDRHSVFNYLRINPATSEAEMRYHLPFRSNDGRSFTFDGLKYMQKDEGGGLRGMQEVLEDYTTLFCHVYEEQAQGRRELGTAYLKFKTFEDAAAVRSLADFLRSFKVTGTDDPLLQLQAQMRFLAFTGQFVQQEYDPLSPDIGALREDVRAEVLRGAETPDFFSTRPTVELQSILRETPTLPIEKLLNKGEVRIDFEGRRIFRDSFWKGSFAKDTLLGWEERVRNAALGAGASQAGSIFAGGSFWKRFDKIENGAARGHVVNYELAFLPGDPEVREVAYPNNSRRYFKEGDKVLLLKYRNQPYRIVYDTIKVIDENNAIGVMHLGDFPDGLEFSTFVMARHNYPFEKMSVEDHHLVFGDPRSTVPAPDQLEGAWDGHLVFLTRPNLSLTNQANPVAFRLQFKRAGSKMEGRYRFGLLKGSMDVTFSDEFVRLDDFTTFHDEIRMIDRDTMIGKWVSPEIHPLMAKGLEDYLEDAGSRFAFYYILKRA